MTLGIIMYGFITIFAIATVFAGALAIHEQNVAHKNRIEEIEQNKYALSETEKQVKIKAGYDGFPDSLLFRSLLEGATTTVRYIKETDTVILRFKLIDDEGKPFFKTFEFDDADEIISYIEIL